ncbi:MULTISPECIES: type II toxin-antitoxin system RelE/ParE family toxin [Burkholderia]|uniref:Type II toxin-antitoxin system RelE/ParE family toxin n=1 Tax=Burkholderia theae TaxID=3143496 RepID=A0ABU9WIG3_9BURK|nr:type II toxin-antitoxin system RelE/ParE family toxin [Burkholderia sp. Z1]
MPASVRRVFKTKWFHKAARKAGIADAELCRTDADIATLIALKELVEICNG